MNRNAVKVIITACCFLLCACAEKIPDELLTIEETLEMAKDTGLTHFKPDAWRGNPAAREIIYEMARCGQNTGMLSYIGLIGDESDVPVLLSFVPVADTETVLVNSILANHIFAALAGLSNRGYTEAGNILGDMTDPKYWEARNVGYEHIRKPFHFSSVANLALYVYCFAGRDDFEQRLTTHLESIEDPKRRIDTEKTLRRSYEHIVKREKWVGTWKVHERQNLKLRTWVLTLLGLKVRIYIFRTSTPGLFWFLIISSGLLAIGALFLLKKFVVTSRNKEISIPTDDL